MHVFAAVLYDTKRFLQEIMQTPCYCNATPSTAQHSQMLAPCTARTSQSSFPFATTRPCAVLSCVLQPCKMPCELGGKPAPALERKMRKTPKQRSGWAQDAEASLGNPARDAEASNWTPGPRNKPEAKRRPTTPNYRAQPCNTARAKTLVQYYR